MSIEQKDIEIFEKMIYKNGDDIAVSIARSFERLEERMDAIESRTYGRLADIDDKIDLTGREILDRLADIEEELQDVKRSRYAMEPF